MDKEVKKQQSSPIRAHFCALSAAKGMVIKMTKEKEWLIKILTELDREFGRVSKVFKLVQAGGKIKEDDAKKLHKSFRRIQQVLKDYIMSLGGEVKGEGEM